LVGRKHERHGDCEAKSEKEKEKGVEKRIKRERNRETGSESKTDLSTCRSRAFVLFAFGALVGHFKEGKEKKEKYFFEQSPLPDL
jgi:hypothetical protein